MATGRNLATRTKRSGLVTALIAAGAVLIVVPVASAKVYSYKVALDFEQTRTWTYHYEQVTATPSCTSTDDGNGLDAAVAGGKALINSSQGSVAGFGLEGEHTRTGTMSHAVGGSECETENSSDPTTGCGDKPLKANFPTLTVAGRHLVLEWDSNPTPDYSDCPYFDGANEASPGNQLPGSAYRDVEIKLPRKAMKRGKKVITGTGEDSKAATETCANLVEPCPVGVSYNATGEVNAKAEVKLKRIGNR